MVVTEEHLKLAWKGTSTEWSLEQLQRAVDMYASKHSLKEIGVAVGYDHGAVRRALVKVGVTIRGRGKDPIPQDRRDRAVKLLRSGMTLRETCKLAEIGMSSAYQISREVKANGTSV